MSSSKQFEIQTLLMADVLLKQNTETVALSMENMKELFREMFKEQEQALIKMLSSCTNTLNQRLDELKL